MRILLIGSGGREHALAWQLRKNPKVSLMSAPGSSALAELGEVKPVAADDVAGLTALARDMQPDLTVIGPELPLVLGLADALRAQGLAVFGPSAEAARIEGSKVFAKDFMIRHNLPTASYAVFFDPAEARSYIRDVSYPIVIKADGLAAGKGVHVCGNLARAQEALTSLATLEAASRIIVEEYLAGEEVSFFVLTDGQTVLPLPSAQDHKAIFDGDRGPNTGGMGAYSPAPLVSPRLESIIMETIMRPAVAGLAAEGTPFCGLLYAGLMVSLSGPKLLEFNARFGDPETQALMPRLKGDLAGTLLAAANGTLHEVSLDWDERPSVCVVMSSAGYPGPFSAGEAISGLGEAAALPGVTVFEAAVSREPRRATSADGQAWVETAFSSGGRVLGVTALGDDLPMAIDRAYRGVEAISFKGAHYRKDIGAKAINRGPLYPDGD
ncbi:MAG: phosphoribosylamine--glycine ligase [Deltaproteobacteria bacterium]|jgi:phosphoribosylamine--glycine ligase|nr:phosphoribosylamine--glycine ligase [Deltaproteobacteria bacterium]